MNEAAIILSVIFVVLVVVGHIHNYRTVQRLTGDNLVLKQSMSYFVGHTWVNENGELLRVSAEKLSDNAYQVKVEYAPADEEDPKPSSE